LPTVCTYNIRANNLNEKFSTATGTLIEIYRIWNFKKYDSGK